MEAVSQTVLVTLGYHLKLFSWRDHVQFPAPFPLYGHFCPNVFKKFEKCLSSPAVAIISGGFRRFVSGSAKPYISSQVHVASSRTLILVRVV